MDQVSNLNTDPKSMSVSSAVPGLAYTLASAISARRKNLVQHGERCPKLASAALRSPLLPPVLLGLDRHL